jgi:outer membrane protein OmpA-like peptidoglycan-associated protein
VKHPTCAGSNNGSVAVSIQGGQPPYRYYWNHNSLLATDHATGLAAGTYEVTILDFAANEYTDVADLMDPAAMHVSIAEDSNAEGFTLVANASGGRGDFVYHWSTGSTDRKIPADAPGTYSATVTDVNGCSVVAEYSVDAIALEIASPESEETPDEVEEDVDAVTVENLKELDPGKLNVGQILRIEQLLFKADSTNIEPESYAVLDGIFTFLNTNQSMVIEIGGHTNGLPDHEYCDRLSTARARSVAEYIVNKGIPPGRIAYHGYGKRLPVASNQTIEGRKKNQRVEVKILQM